MDRRNFLAGSLAGAGIATIPGKVSAKLSHDGAFAWIIGNIAWSMHQHIATIPACPVGTGAKLYVVSSADCPGCKVMDREYPGVVPNFRVEYLAYPLSHAGSGAAQKVWSAPSFANYKRYMAGAYRTVPPLPDVSRITDYPKTPRNALEQYKKTLVDIRTIYFDFNEHGGVPPEKPGYIAISTPGFFLPFFLGTTPGIVMICRGRFAAAQELFKMMSKSKDFRFL